VSSVRSFCIRVLAAIALSASCLAGAGAQQAETPELYGFGNNAKGEPTYFRVRLPSVAVVDIGPDGFPFPAGTAYDSLHDRYYWIELDARGAGTLWVSQGLHGRPTALGSSGPFLGASVVLAYNQVNGLLYALAAAPERATSVLFSIDPATGQRTTVSEYAGSPTQISCDNYSGCVYLSAAGEQLLVYQPPQASLAYWESAPPIASSTPLFTDLHAAVLWTLDAGDPTQGRAAQLLGYGYGNVPYAGRLTYQVPLTLLEGVDPSRIERLFGAPSETGNLYGYGTDEKGGFTYFRFSVVQAEATDIGADAFPFPLDAAYDPVHNVRYSIGLTEGPSYTTNTLYATDGRSGRTTPVGTLSETVEAYLGASLAYQASNGWLYVTTLSTQTPQSLFKIDPASLVVTSLGPDTANQVASLLCNPSTGDLYGITVDTSGIAMWLRSLATETGQLPGPGIGFQPEWSLMGPVFDPSGRYFCVVGYQTSWIGFSEPAHLLVFDLEAPLDKFGTGLPVLLAPLPPLTYYGFIGSPSIDTLFFAPPL
jgi:hypothetical protein